MKNMTHFHYDVLICASVLPTAGINTNLFLNCIPVDDMVETVAPLLKDELLALGRFKIALNADYAKTADLSEHENPAVMLDFLERLLKEMATCPKVEDNREYISVLHTFHNACKRLCGRTEELDDKLAELSASLVDLLEEPFFHFITTETKLEDENHLAFLTNAEEALVLRVLARAYEVPEASKQLKLFMFIRRSLQSISYAHHNWLGINESTEHIDSLIELIDERIAKLEVMFSLEQSLAELAREFDSLQEDDN